MCGKGAGGMERGRVGGQGTGWEGSGAGQYLGWGREGSRAGSGHWEGVGGWGRAYTLGEGAGG